jgi:hypothetical protein
MATFEIVVAPFVAQVYLGIILGNLKDGVSVRFMLSRSNGHLRFSPKNRNEVWIDPGVKIAFGGSYNEQYKILSL